MFNSDQPINACSVQNNPPSDIAYNSFQFQDIVKSIMDPSYVGKILIPNMGSIYKLSTINLKMMLIPSMGEIYKQSTIKCRNDANISY